MKLEDIKDSIVSSIVRTGEDISRKVVTFNSKNHNDLDRKIDSILTSKKRFGIPIMISLFRYYFWITIEGANLTPL